MMDATKYAPGYYPVPAGYDSWVKKDHIEKAPVFQGENLERREPVSFITGHPWYHSLCCTFCGCSHFARSALCGESLPL